MKTFLKKQRLKLSFLGLFLLATYTGIATWSPPYGTGQVITHADLAAMAATSPPLVAYVAPTPTWTTTDGQGATVHEINIYINGCSAMTPNPTSTTSQLATFNLVHGCAVTTTVHSPLILNNSFALGNVDWTQAASSGTGILGVAPVITNETAQDDTFDDVMTASSATCSANTTTTCQGTSSQTFTISGTPTSQSLKFYYYVTDVAATGDAVNCSPASGYGSLTVKVNSSTYTLSTVTYNSWTFVSPTGFNALVNGSNTITVTFSGQSTNNQSSRFNLTTQVYNCTSTWTSNKAKIDDIVLTASW